MFGFIAVSILPFMVLFLILIAAFADAFYTISNSLVEDSRLDKNSELKNPYEARFIPQWYDSFMYSYFTGAGEFDTDSFEKLSGNKPALAWIVFAMATFVNFVIVLNLLIAVVNDMHTKASQE
jgi:quinol-cytochrome oxidoreductase complex cytochrome b subunit